MSTQRYSVAPHPIETLLTWVKSNEIAIPEIQRPFVWEPKKVRDLLDSLYRGYPVGYLIAWRNPNVKLKDGTTSAGKRILIDGQQRVTALMAAILGVEVLTKDYATVRIKIAFNPLEEKFEVSTPIIAKDGQRILAAVRQQRRFQALPLRCIHSTSYYPIPHKTGFVAVRYRSVQQDPKTLEGPWKASVMDPAPSRGPIRRRRSRCSQRIPHSLHPHAYPVPDISHPAAAWIFHSLSEQTIPDNGNIHGHHRSQS